MDRSWRIGISCVALCIALISARPFAGSWNDGSRLATVESLIDHGTLVIDDSVFVTPPSRHQTSPYRPGDPIFQSAGTKDKLLINGHYYSDKSPLPAFPMAAVYGAYRGLGGSSAAERPDLFCLLMTWITSGLAFLIASVCIFGISRRCGLSPNQSGVLTFLFMLGTIALPYAQHVNNHMLLLAVASGLFLQLLIGDAEGWSILSLVRAGMLAGIAYTIDLGAGPPLTLLTLGYIGWRTRSFRSIIALIAALPWIAFHHVVNYAIGGTFIPANAVPAYLDWPGSPFTSGNMTGAWAHTPLLNVFPYAFEHLEKRERWLLGRSTAVIRRLRWFRIDLTRLADEVTNITKFIGDWHLARVYESAKERFHIDEWRNSVEQRLKQLDKLFSVVHAEVSERRMMVLELIVVLLILIEVLNTFFGRH